MKPLNILTALLFICIVTPKVHAQIDLEVETQSGYEYNYFRSPDMVRFNGELLTENDLIASSFYQKVSMDFEYEKEWGANRLRLIAKPNAMIFYENMDDNFWDITGTIKYYHELGRTNTTFLAEGQLKRMDRTGLDGAQDVLVNPLGYTNIGAKTGLEFEPIGNNKTKVMAFFNFRDFDEFGQRDLEFKEIGVSAASKQKLKIANAKHEIGVNAYYKIRKYDTFNATNIIADGVRDWSYFKINPYYNLPIGNNLEVEPSFVLYNRMDKIDRSGFSQFGPELKIDYDSSKTEIGIDVSYLTRNYKSIEARDNNGLIGEKLSYTYLQFSIDFEYELIDNLFITARVFSRIRDTNYTDLEARSFRGYRNQYAGAGLKWEF